MSVVIETTIGDFTVDLFVDERPQTCKNFLKLCKTKYYNFCLFHSVQHNFIAQTGDPTGTGKSGESVFKKVYGEERKYFAAEMVPKVKHSRSGLLSMVNCGNNMLGSQFFLTLSDELQSLDGEHCVFGEVGEGHEILLKLNEVICDTDHRPYQDIRITHTVILEDPFEDPPGLEIPDQSPEPSKETLLNGRIAPDEELDEGKGLSVQQLEELVRAREAQAQATILEIVGDLPDADMAPPENVLFICKLNPVTSDDDLEIIFSRFGKVKSCEVIRDKVSGDSLQYAFVEFEEQKSCEDAFFKMDNVLIDDRRIHVDFSQSVSKIRWKGKGRGVEHVDENSSKNPASFSERQDLRGSNREDRSRESAKPARYTSAKLERFESASGRDDRHRKKIPSENRSVDRRDDYREKYHDRPNERYHRRERDVGRSEHSERNSEREQNDRKSSSKHNSGRDETSRSRRDLVHKHDIDRKETKRETRHEHYTKKSDESSRRQRDTRNSPGIRSEKRARSSVSDSDSDAGKMRKKKHSSKKDKKGKGDDKQKKMNEKMSKKAKASKNSKSKSSSSSDEEPRRSKKSKKITR